MTLWISVGRHGTVVENFRDLDYVVEQNAHGIEVSTTVDETRLAISMVADGTIMPLSQSPMTHDEATAYAELINEAAGQSVWLTDALATDAREAS